MLCERVGEDWLRPAGCLAFALPLSVSISWGGGTRACAEKSLEAEWLDPSPAGSGPGLPARQAAPEEASLFL